MALNVPSVMAHVKWRVARHDWRNTVPALPAPQPVQVDLV